MSRFVGLDVSQKLTSICVVDAGGRRVWRGQCPTQPDRIEQVVRRHAGEGAALGFETGPMTPWLIHELRGRELDVVGLIEPAGLATENSQTPRHVMCK